MDTDKIVKEAEEKAEAVIGTVEKTTNNVWGFIKTHTVITAIAVVGLFCAWNLVVEISKANTALQQANDRMREVSDSTGVKAKPGCELQFASESKKYDTARETKEQTTPVLGIAKGISVLSVAVLFTTLIIYAFVSVPFLSRITKGDDGKLDGNDSANLLKFGAVVLFVCSAVLTIFVGFVK